MEKMKINIEIEDNVELQPINRGKFLDADTIAKLKSMEIGQSFVVLKVQQVMVIQQWGRKVGKRFTSRKIYTGERKDKNFTFRVWLEGNCKPVEPKPKKHDYAKNKPESFGSLSTSKVESDGVGSATERSKVPNEILTLVELKEENRMIVEDLDKIKKILRSFFSSGDKTFCDPNCGTGIEICEAVRELFDQRHGAQNIINRVTGFCENESYLLSAKRNLMHTFEKYGNHCLTSQEFSGMIKIENFLTYEEMKVKFDVFLGNPPFNEPTNSKHASSKKKGRANLSVQFIERAMEFLAPGGVIAFITSDHFLRPTSRVRNIMVENGHFIHADITTDQIKKEYFPGIGSTFTWWVWQNVEGENAVVCEGKHLPNSVLSSKVYANTGKYDDWVFSLGKTGDCFDWKRTKNNPTPLIVARTVIVPLSSTSKTVIYDGSNMPKNKDFYYHVFQNSSDANKVRDHLLSEEGKRMIKINKSGPALSKEVFINMPLVEL